MEPTVAAQHMIPPLEGLVNLGVAAVGVEGMVWDRQQLGVGGDNCNMLLPHRVQDPCAELVVAPAKEEALSADGGDDHPQPACPCVLPQLFLGDIPGQQTLVLQNIHPQQLAVHPSLWEMHLAVEPEPTA